MAAKPYFKSQVSFLDLLSLLAAAAVVAAPG